MFCLFRGETFNEIKEVLFFDHFENDNANIILLTNKKQFTIKDNNKNKTRKMFYQYASGKKIYLGKLRPTNI